MSKTKQVERINADAVQVLNDYRAALAALGLPYSATPLDVRERIERFKSDMLALACLYDEILGAGRVSSSDDFRAAISAVRLLRDKVDNLEKQPCSHPKSSIVSSSATRDCTNYCRDCAITYTADDGNVCHYHSGCKDCLENLEQVK